MNVEMSLAVVHDEGRRLSGAQLPVDVVGGAGGDLPALRELDQHPSFAGLATRARSSPMLHETFAMAIARRSRGRQLCKSGAGTVRSRPSRFSR
jgi:hypothetical protein